MATTWNASDQLDVTVSGAGLVASGAAAGNNQIRATDALGAGKYYWEVVLTTYSGTGTQGVGLASSTHSFSGTYLGHGSGQSIGKFNQNTVWDYISAGVGAGTTSVQGDRLGIAVDNVNKLIWITKDGTNWFGSTSGASPSGGTGGQSFSNLTSIVYPALNLTTGDVSTGVFAAGSWGFSPPSGFVEIFPPDESIRTREDDSAQTAIFAAWSDANEIAVQDRHWVQIIQADLAVSATQGLYQDWGEDSGWPAWIAANESAVQENSWFPEIGADAGGSTYNDTVTETGSAADTLTGLGSLVGTVTEAGSAADSVTGLRVSTDAVNEAGSAADTVAGLQVITNAIAEAGAAADTVSAALVAVGAVSEAGTAAETLTTVLTAVGAITEAGTAADTLTGLLVASAAISEAASAADTVTGGSLFNDTVSETASAADTVTGLRVGVGAVSETASAADTTTAVLAALGAVSESGSASDTVSAALVAVGGISETVSAVDTPDFVASQTYNESVSEASAAVDSLSATGGSVTAAEGLPYGGGVSNVSRKRFKDLQRQIKAERKAAREAIQTGDASPQEPTGGDAPPGAGIVAGGLLSASTALPADEGAETDGPLLSIGTSPNVASAEELVARIADYQAQQEAHAAAVHAAMMQDEEEAVLVLLLAA